MRKGKLNATTPISHSGHLSIALVMGLALLLSSCGSQQTRTENARGDETEPVSSTIRTVANNLRAGDLQKEGITIITPSSITGHEEDKQALALAFTGVLRELRPDMRVVPLPQTLSAINRAGLTSEYKTMFEDYRLTGIFDREILRKVADLTGTRYLAQLKLGAFQQIAKGRWGLLGIRMMETKSSTIRLFLQIWDSNDGSIVWEGSEETTLSHDSFAEENVTLRSVVERSAHHLVARFP